VAVAGLGLHAQQHAQVFDRSAIGLAQYRQSLVVVLALCVLSEASAADDIGSSYARVDAQCDEDIRTSWFRSRLVCNQVGGVKEMASLTEATAPDIWGARANARHLSLSVLAVACSARHDVRRPLGRPPARPEAQTRHAL